MTRNTKRLSMTSMDELPAFPEGWYFVASRESILREKLIEKTWLGEEIVAWCDEAGRVCVADAVCPHLGSYLGPEAGGQVCNGRLVCPFHGFAYDTTGQCVATPNAPAPRAAKLKVYQTREILGLVFAWFGSGGRLPHWALPGAPPTGAEWSELGFRTLRFRGHPQETAENAVDLGHLRYVHGYDNVSPVGSVKSYFDFKRVRRLGVSGRRLPEELLRLQTRSQNPGCKRPRVRSLGRHPRLWTGLLLRRNPRENHRYGFEIVGTSYTHRWHPHRSCAGRPSAGNPQAPAVHHGSGFRTDEAAPQADESHSAFTAKTGGAAGRGDLGPEAASVHPQAVRTVVSGRPHRGGSGRSWPGYRRYCRQFYPELQPERPGSDKVKSTI